MITIGENSNYGSFGQNTCVLYETGQGQSPDGPPPTLPQTSSTSISATETIAAPFTTPGIPVVEKSSLRSLATTIGLPIPTITTASVAMPVVTHGPHDPHKQSGSSIAAGVNSPGSSSQATQAGSPSAVTTARAAGAQIGVSESSDYVVALDPFNRA